VNSRNAIKKDDRAVHLMFMPLKRKEDRAEQEEKEKRSQIPSRRWGKCGALLMSKGRSPVLKQEKGKGEGGKKKVILIVPKRGREREEGKPSDIAHGETIVKNFGDKNGLCAPGQTLKLIWMQRRKEERKKMHEHLRARRGSADRH